MDDSMGLSRRRFMSLAAAAPLAYAVGFPGSAPAGQRHRHAHLRLQPVSGSKVKVFDSADNTGFGAVTSIQNFADVTLVRRDRRWHMIAASSDQVSGRIELFSATLPQGAPLSATGWRIDTVPGDPTTAKRLLPLSPEGAWDSLGGRHCPSYVRGWDPSLRRGRGGWEERIYYAGATERPYGPFAIGYARWDGEQWVPGPDQPVLTATEPWESPVGAFGGVFEPNLVYDRGKWRAWYAAGPPDDDGHMPHGYAESVDGRTGWRKKVYWPSEREIFDNQVIRVDRHRHHRGRGGEDHFEALFAHMPALKYEPTPDWGIWWQHGSRPYDDPDRWSEPVQLVATGDGTPWHANALWKPALTYSDVDPHKAFLFFDGGYFQGEEFFYPLGCIECVVDVNGGSAMS